MFICEPVDSKFMDYDEYRVLLINYARMETNNEITVLRPTPTYLYIVDKLPV